MLLNFRVRRYGCRNLSWEYFKLRLFITARLPNYEIEIEIMNSFSSYFLRAAKFRYRRRLRATAAQAAGTADRTVAPMTTQQQHKTRPEREVALNFLQLKRINRIETRLSVTFVGFRCEIIGGVDSRLVGRHTSGSCTYNTISQPTQVGDQYIKPRARRECSSLMISHRWWA
jgi:hypothetical protein